MPYANAKTQACSWLWKELPLESQQKSLMEDKNVC